MTTEPARPNQAAHAAAALVFTTLTLGGVITIALTFTPLPWWLAVAPLWAPFAALYVAVVVAASVTFARALVRGSSQ